MHLRDIERRELTRCFQWVLVDHALSFEFFHVRCIVIVLFVIIGFDG